jgi:hypothetical protein
MKVTSPPSSPAGDFSNPFDSTLESQNWRMAKIGKDLARQVDKSPVLGSLLLEKPATDNTYSTRIEDGGDTVPLLKPNQKETYFEAWEGDPPVRATIPRFKKSVKAGAVGILTSVSLAGGLAGGLTSSSTKEKEDAYEDYKKFITDHGEEPVGFEGYRAGKHEEQVSRIEFELFQQALNDLKEVNAEITGGMF